MKRNKANFMRIVVLFKWNLTQLGFMSSYKKAEG